MRDFAAMIAIAVRCGTRDFLVTVPPRLYLATILPRLVTQILFFALIGRFLGGQDLLLYALVGNAVVSVAGYGMNTLAQNLTGMLHGGTLAMLVTTPTNPLWPIAAWGSGQLLLAFVNGLVGLFVLAPLFGLALAPTAPLVAPVLALTTLSVAGLGLIIAAVSLRTQGAFLIGSSLLFVLFALVGANFPVAALPHWLQPVGWFLPLSHGLLAIRALLTGSSLDRVPLWVAEEAGIGLLYLLLGGALFQAQITAGRRRGTLDFAG
jgi:ABC-2 type transport system permease protein